METIDKKYNNKEIDDFATILIKYKEEVTQTKESSMKFLNELGVLNTKGEFTNQYKHLCIPEVQE